MKSCFTKQSNYINCFNNIQNLGVCRFLSLMLKQRKYYKTKSINNFNCCYQLDKLNVRLIYNTSLTTTIRVKSYLVLTHNSINI